MNLKLIETDNELYHIDATGKIQGEYRRRYRSGARQVRSFYVDDKAEGMFRSWHENGTPCVNCMMKNNAPHGEYLMLHDCGSVNEHTIHIDGVTIVTPEHIDVTDMSETDMFELKLLYGDIGFLRDNK